MMTQAATTARETATAGRRGVPRARGGNGASGDASGNQAMESMKESEDGNGGRVACNGGTWGQHVDGSQGLAATKAQTVAHLCSWILVMSDDGSYWVLFSFTGNLCVLGMCVFWARKRICASVIPCVCTVAKRDDTRLVACFPLENFGGMLVNNVHFSRLCMDSHQTGIAQSSAVPGFSDWCSGAPPPSLRV